MTTWVEASEQSSSWQPETVERRKRYGKGKYGVGRYGQGMPTDIIFSERSQPANAFTEV